MDVCNNLVLHAVVLFALFLEMQVVFEMVCKDRGGVVQTCDRNGDFRCKCAFGYVYDSENNLCLPTF